jgi:uncharacterized protein (DUF39 family)
VKTIKEINERIRKGIAVVLTASEVKKLAEKKSPSEIAGNVDVVTTATFSPMCSSGVFLNLGHTSPPMKMQKVFLDGVPAYGGIATVDIYLGATEQNPDNPRFGGAHVIHKLVKGLQVKISAEGMPTDCYPRKYLSGKFRLDQINQAFFFNPRNCYQNYNAATNSSDKTLFTYMGKLNPRLGSVNYSGAGEISPLLNDPELKTIGIGTAFFFCGTTGYVSWEGTQFNAEQEKDSETDLPIGPGATLALIGNLKEMKPEFIRPVVIPGYGISISLGMGFAIPVINEDIAKSVIIRNKQIKTRLIDYATGKLIGLVNYEELMSGKVELSGKKIPSRTMTDIRASADITRILQDWIRKGKFLITEPVKKLPFEGSVKKFPES